MLIHFGKETIERLLPSASARMQMADNTFANSIACYCQWASHCMGSVGVLLPTSARDRLKTVMAESDQISPIWYSDKSLNCEIAPATLGQSWLINGNIFPVLNWHQTHELRQQYLSDILVYRRRDDREMAPTYPEYVTLADCGAVIGVERRYNDSPKSLCQEAGPIVLLASGYMFTAELVDLVLSHGWDSIHFEKLADRRSTEWVATPAMSFAPETLEPVHMVTGGSISISTDSTDSTENPSRLESLESTLRSLSSHDGVAAELTSDDDLLSTLGAQLRQPDPTSTRNRNGHKNGKNKAISFSSVAPSPNTAFMCDPRTSLKCAIYEISKRAIDLSISVTLLIVLSPLLLAVALLVRVTSKGPIFYQDTRQTLNGKEFECLKFRTMVANASELQQSLRGQNEVDGPQFKLSQDPRLTHIGDFLRRYNLDELPQLINVLVGDMSLVGPRPSPDHENQLCPGWRRTRLSVKSGISGLWQVMRMRDAGQSDFQEWIYYDVEYAKHRSTWLDLQILLYTPFTVFSPHMLDGFAKRLARLGICTQSTRLCHHEYKPSDLS